MTRTQNDLNTTSPLPAHEVCKVLTEVALGKRIMRRSTIQSWGEIYHGLMNVEIDGWLDELTEAGSSGHVSMYLGQIKARTSMS